MPITLTSSALHERFRSFSPKDAVGRPMAVCAPIDQGVVGTRIAYRVPNDKVLLVTHVLTQVDDGFLLSAQAPASPTAVVTRGLQAGSPGTTHLDAAFLGFRRWLTTFDPSVGATASWRGAQPGNAIVWKPRYPIPIGPGIEVRASALIGDMGHPVGAYGYLVDKDQAGSLGFPVQNQGAAADRRYSLSSSAGSAAPGTSDVLLEGRAGRSIRLLDIHVRAQPASNSLLEIELSQHDGTTERIFWKVGNANIGDLMETAFAPDIYLKEGADLRIRTTRQNECSVVVSAEYVDARHLPLNHWWAMVEPTLPDGNGPLGGTGNAFGIVSTQVTPYFPGRDVVGSAAPGHQFVVHGYSFFVQQDSVAQTDKLMFALSGGTSAGSIYSSFVTLPAQTNVQISPVLTANTHDQLLYGVVDDVCIPVDGDYGSPNATQDPGSIWIDSIGYNAVSGAPSATMNTLGWAVSLWGRMTRVRDQFLTNEGE